MPGIAKEVKEVVLNKVKSGESVTELSSQYGISNRTIYAWLRKKAEGSVSVLEFNKLKRENQQLKEIVGILTLELEKTKKRSEIRELIERRVTGIKKSLLAEVLRVARATIYRESGRIKEKDERLQEEIIRVLASNPSYGHRRVALALGIGKRRARRVMKKFGLKPYKRKARWKKRKDLEKRSAPYQNQIENICPIKPQTIYVSDFTRIAHRSGVLYLATLMDLFTREVVGWNISNRHNKELVLETVIDSLINTGLAIPRIVHSDQGSEYCSKKYIKLMMELGILISMSKKKSPWENAYQEPFYNNFKTDLGLEFDRFRTLGELIEGIHQTIDYYNNRRIHTSLKMSPVKFREQYYLST